MEFTRDEVNGPAVGVLLQSWELDWVIRFSEDNILVFLAGVIFGVPRCACWSWEARLKQEVGGGRLVS